MISSWNQRFKKISQKPHASWFGSKKNLIVCIFGQNFIGSAGMSRYPGFQSQKNLKESSKTGQLSLKPLCHKDLLVKTD